MSGSPLFYLWYNGQVLQLASEADPRTVFLVELASNSGCLVVRPEVDGFFLAGEAEEHYAGEGLRMLLQSSLPLLGLPISQQQLWHREARYLC